MSFSNKNLSIWFLVIWFAILQTLSPFVHAHMDNNGHPDLDNGLHVHSIPLSITKQDISKASINDYALDTHIVVIDKGVIQRLQWNIQTIALITVFIFFALPITKSKLKTRRQIILKPRKFKINLNPRAPPHF